MVLKNCAKLNGIWEDKSNAQRKGVNSVAQEGFGTSMVVSYTKDPSVQNAKFVNLGMQIAAGVPLKCDEPDNFAIRLGFFGFDKLYDVLNSRSFASCYR